MYRGKLTAAFLLKSKTDGKSEMSTDGRYIGGVKFFGNTYTTFDVKNVDMDKINKFVDEGYLEINKVSSKSRPPAEKVKPVDLMEQAEIDVAEDKEIKAEVEKTVKKRGRPAGSKNKGK